MLGWLRAAAARASCSKRVRRSGSVEKPAGRTLTATSRPKPGIVGAVHLAHPPRSNRGRNDVWAEPRAGSDHRRETSTHPGLGKVETELSWETGVIIAVQT